MQTLAIKIAKDPVNRCWYRHEDLVSAPVLSWKENVSVSACICTLSAGWETHGSSLVSQPSGTESSSFKERSCLSNSTSTEQRQAFDRYLGFPPALLRASPSITRICPCPQHTHNEQKTIIPRIEMMRMGVTGVQWAGQFWNGESVL